MQSNYIKALVVIMLLLRKRIGSPLAPAYVTIPLAGGIKTVKAECAPRMKAGHVRSVVGE